MLTRLRRIEKIDLLLVCVAPLIPLLIGIAGWWLLGPAAILISISAAVVLILIVQLEIYQRQKLDYRQIEALMSLFSTAISFGPAPAIMKRYRSYGQKLRMFFTESNSATWHTGQL